MAAGNAGMTAGSAGNAGMITGNAGAALSARDAELRRQNAAYKASMMTSMMAVGAVHDGGVFSGWLWCIYRVCEGGGGCL